MLFIAIGDGNTLVTYLFISIIFCVIAIVVFFPGSSLCW